MAECKYTKEGKKVSVIGKLNNEEWIVQEIFVADGKEFPAGENFTTRTLLDKPAETYQERHNKSLSEEEVRLKNSIKKLGKEMEILKRKALVGKLINHATAIYEDINLKQLDTLFAFMAGEITHVIAENYGGWEIVSLIDAVESTDNFNYIKSEGLKLVSLFGCDTQGKRGQGDYSLRLDWRINQYRDGSGSCWYTIYPCKSYEDAIAKLDELVAAKEKATEKLIALKEKYGLQNPTAEQIAIYRQSCIQAKQETIAKKRMELDKLTKELAELER